MFALILPLFFTEVHCYVPGSSLPIVTYKELRSLNASCGERDTCERSFNDELLLVNCQCVQLGTCCLDAPYVGPKKSYGGGLGCVNVYGTKDEVFMVDKCSSDWDGDDLCTADGEERSDVTLLVPVTSLQTGITYRNYFCFICNSFDDSEDSLMSWDIKYFNNTFYSHLSNASDIDPFYLTFNESLYQWTHPQAPDKSFELQMSMPEKIQKYIIIPYESIICRSLFRVVDSCAPNWTEPLTRSKCGSYTALVRMTKDGVNFDVYRNVHCGICNWADIRNTDFRCEGLRIASDYWYTITLRAENVLRSLFRIDELSPRCPEGYRYFKFVNSCRRFRCGLRGKGKC